jgi:hypothetical protein
MLRTWPPHPFAARCGSGKGGGGRNLSNLGRASIVSRWPSAPNAAPVRATRTDFAADAAPLGPLKNQLTHRTPPRSNPHPIAQAPSPRSALSICRMRGPRKSGSQCFSGSSSARSACSIAPPSEPSSCSSSRWCCGSDSATQACSLSSPSARSGPGAPPATRRPRLSEQLAVALE